MMKDACNFGAAVTPRRRAFERVVALVWIECPQLVTHDHLVLREHRRASFHIIHDIEVGCGAAVVGEPGVRRRKRGERDREIESRQKRPRRRDGSQRLLRIRERDGKQGGHREHDYSHFNLLSKKVFRDVLFSLPDGDTTMKLLFGLLLVLFSSAWRPCAAQDN